MHKLRLGLALASALLIADSARALSVHDIGFHLEINSAVIANNLYGLPVQVTFDPLTGDYGYELTGPVADPGGDWTINSWSTTYLDDPFVTNNVNITNSSGIAQSYIISVAIPITAFNYDQIVFSSVGFSATDSNGNGSLSVTSPIFYDGTVNGVSKLTLLDPVSIGLANCSPLVTPGCTATTSDGVLNQTFRPAWRPRSASCSRSRSRPATRSASPAASRSSRSRRPSGSSAAA